MEKRITFFFALPIIICVVFLYFNFRSDKNKYPIHYAIAADDLKQIKELIEIKKYDINAKAYIKNYDVDLKGITPLQSTIIRAQQPFFHHKNQIKIATYLISKGADVNFVDDNGNTALHIAVEKNDIAFVELLLNNHADIDIKNNMGQIPIDIADIKRNDKIIKLLRSKK